MPKKDTNPKLAAALEAMNQIKERFGADALRRGSSPRGESPGTL